MFLCTYAPTPTPFLVHKHLFVHIYIYMYLHTYMYILHISIYLCIYTQTTHTPLLFQKFHPRTSSGSPYFYLIVFCTRAGGMSHINKAALTVLLHVFNSQTQSRTLYIFVFVHSFAGDIPRISKAALCPLSRIQSTNPFTNSTFFGSCM